MNLKTYRAHTMAEALSEVKKDLGKDAVILHARTLKVGGMLGVGAKQMVEITASDRADAAGPKIRDPKPKEPAFTPTRFQSVTTPDNSSPRPPAPEAAPLIEVPSRGAGTGKPATSRTRMEPAAPVRVEPSTEVPRVQVRASPPRMPLPHTPVAPAPADAGSAEELKAELASIRALVNQVLRCTREASLSSRAASGVVALGGVSEPLMELMLKLQQSGMSAELIEKLAVSARSCTAELSGETVHTLLAQLLPRSERPARPGPQKDGRPLTIALTGPTGVGKTTTIAKLAATYKLRLGVKVGLVTADTYRIAAIEQLRTYANIIGLPVRVAMTPQELQAAVEGFEAVDVILVDTAGRSQRDGSRLEELRQLVSAASPHETHLVLSASMSEGVLQAAVEKFKLLSPNRIMVTKMDEGVELGAVMNVIAGAGLPLSYLTTGQEVPDDIEPADGLVFAKALLRSLSDGGRGE